MDELIKMVADRTGLAPDKAQAAVETVMSFLKTKLPPALASQIDNVAAGNLTGLANNLPGFGGLADMAKGVEKTLGM
jgi:nucleoid DNA-binding protein